LVNVCVPAIKHGNPAHKISKSGIFSIFILLISPSGVIQ